MDVLGIAYDDFTHDQRDHVCTHHPREADFKESIIDHFAAGIRSTPLPTFGTVKADVLEMKVPGYLRQNFCSIILGSAWPHCGPGGGRPSRSDERSVGQECVIT